MADVFISYAREDKSRIVPFVELLESQGWTVWWDRQIEPGHSFGDEIDKQVSQAGCVVVFWSRHSVQSNWVQVEANEGLERGVLVPLLLDDVRVPLVFRRSETVSLIGWPNREKRDELERALQAMARAIGRSGQTLNLSHRRPGLVRAGALGAIAAVVLALMAVMALHYRSAVPAIAASTPPHGAPVASIAVMPFANMEADIAPELSHLLGETGSFYVEGQDQIEAHIKNPAVFELDARYTLQGTQTAAGLTVSLFDRARGETLWTRTFDPHAMPVPRLVQTIASDVAGVFNRPAINVADVPHDAYIAFLQAKAQMHSDAGAGGYRHAVALYEKAIADAPHFAEAYAGLCQTYTSMYSESKNVKYFHLAEQRCFRAAALSDNNVNVDVALGKLYRTSGKPQASLERLEAARREAPFSTEVLRQLALVKHALKLDDEAEALLSYAQELEPNYWENYDALARIYFETGRYRQAAGQYEKERKLVLNKTRTLNDLGSAWYMAGDLPNAIKAWRASLQSGVTAPALSNLGSAYFFSGEFQKAAESYRKAVALHPNDARLWANTGEALVQTGKDGTPYFKKALGLTLAQLKVNPNLGESLSLAASSYAAVGNAADSRKYIAKALTVAQHDVYALYDVAVAYTRLGDTVHRQQTLDRMVSMGYSRELIEKDANLNPRMRYSHAKE